LRSLGLYSKFSALYTPAVRNTSKLYSIVSADGDATVTRGSVKNINTATGTLEEIASDVTPSSFGTGGWGALVEGQRTNLLLRSEEFDDAYWTKSPSVTVTGNTQIINNLVFYEIDFTSSNSGNIQRQLTLPESSHTLSFYIFKGTRNKIRLNYGNPGLPPFLDVVLTDTPTRYTLSFQGTGTSLSVSLQGEGGDNAGTIWVSGAQLEAGSFASSYMKTEGATFTRSADVITKTGASDLIGQTQGTLYVEFDYRQNSAERRILSVTDGTSTNRLIVWTLNNILYFTANTGESTILKSPITTGINAVAINYNISGGNTALQASVNGGAIISATQVASPINLARIDIGNREDNSLQFNDRILLAGISKTALTQAEAIALTT
jgi:hypothetical protein